MTIPFLGPESLFVRLGHIFKTLDILNEQRGSDIPPRIDLTFSDFENTNQDLVENIYTSLSTYQNAVGTLPSALQIICRNIITSMVNDDLLQTSLTSIPVCMNTVVSQMISASQTVQSCIASGNVVADPSNNGNANVIVGLKDPAGLVQENAFNELIRCLVVADSQSNGSIEGREQINCQGQATQPDSLFFDYPKGSGSNIGVTCVDASQYQQRGNRNNLNNGNFEVWTIPNTPDGWRIQIGTPGVSVKRNTSIFYDGVASLELDGDGVELTTLYQQFATNFASGDTTTPITSITQLAVNAWIKVDVAPVAGVLRFALVDGSGNVLNDEQGVPSLITADLTTVGSTFVPFSGFFRTPRVLPSGVRFQIKLTTALSTGSSVFIDRLAMAVPFVAYQGGPSIAAFSGNTKLINGDSYSVNVVNDYGGQIQRNFDRFFGMRQMNLLLPSSNSPTISDSLIS